MEILHVSCLIPDILSVLLTFKIRPTLPSYHLTRGFVYGKVLISLYTFLSLIPTQLSDCLK